MTKEGTILSVDFGFPELIEVLEEFQDVGSAAAGESQGGTMVPQVLPKRVPVTPLLRLVTA